MSKNKIILLSSFVFVLLSTITPAFAHCPLCTAATGAAVAVTRLYGVDDLIVGTFIGGMIISTAVWFNDMLRKRKKGRDYIPFQYWIMILLSLVSTVVTFYFAGLIISSNPHFMIFGVSKILVGMVVGSIVSLIAFKFHDFLKIRNGNKSHVRFQVIILTLVFLSLSSLLYYLIGWI